MPFYSLASSAWCAARMASGAAKRMSELKNRRAFKKTSFAKITKKFLSFSF